MIRHVGANMESVRKKNRSTILKYLNDGGPSSRKDLADVTGLTPAAVTQICTELLSEGILQETGMNVQSSGAGRKKIYLDINYDVAYVFAINIEPEYTVIALSNLKGEQIELHKSRTKTEFPPEEFLKKVSDRCKGIKEKHPEVADRITAVGVGITGIVDTPEGISRKAYGIWDEPVNVGKILGENLDLPVFLENNVNAFALGELYYGTGKEHDNLMVIKWGPGVGCAMIIDQQIYEGRHNKAAELGHFIVDPKGAKCSCGRRGCLETKISYQALNQIVSFEEGEFGKAYESVAAEGKKNPFDDAIDIFARSIVNSATIMAPNRIVIMGSLFKTKTVRDKLIEACGNYDASWGEGRVVYSGLASREGYIGPVAICAKQLLF